jgi:hypothetical protein
MKKIRYLISKMPHYTRREQFVQVAKALGWNAVCADYREDAKNWPFAYVNLNWEKGYCGFAAKGSIIADEGKRVSLSELLEALWAKSPSFHAVKKLPTSTSIDDQSNA